MQIADRFLTDRLIIRNPIITDATEIFKKYAQSSDVTKYLTWTPHLNFEMTENFIKWCISQWEVGECFPYTICLKSTKEVIGMIDTRINGIKVDFGYVLAKEYWKQGYMAEALKPIIDELFNKESIYRIWAVCDIDNYGSKRVMEKIGMKFEGILRKWIMHPNISKVPRDCFMYSIVKEE
jgi:ribosomal-protein-alanine N-acetyltransferase